MAQVPVQRQPAADTETPWHQAVREFPSDIEHAFSPTGLSDSTSLIGRSMKSGYENLVDAIKRGRGR